MTDSRVVSPVVAVAAGASTAAGLVHASASGAHSADALLAGAFAVVAVAQLGWAAFVVWRPSRAALLVGAAIQTGALAALGLALTTGVPGVSSLPGQEPLGLHTGLVAVLQAIALVASVGALTRRSGRVVSPAFGAFVLIAALVVGVPAMAAEPTHEHDEVSGHAHEDGAEDAPTEATEGHAHEESGEPGVDTAPWDPELTDVHASHEYPYQHPPTEAQLRDAVELVEATGEASKVFPDVAAAEAAGFISIHDAFEPGDFEHYISIEYNLDDVNVEPTRPESLVYRWEEDGSKTLVSYMYIMTDGLLMDDVPDIAGSLTPWHDHNDLCTDEFGIEILGVWDEKRERCDPGGQLDIASAPMMHVWVTPNECGPFAGIETHGATSCEHAH